jgi:hypothetical protein
VEEPRVRVEIDGEGHVGRSGYSRLKLRRYTAPSSARPGDGGLRPNRANGSLARGPSRAVRRPAGVLASWFRRFARSVREAVRSRHLRRPLPCPGISVTWPCSPYPISRSLR